MSQFKSWGLPSSRRYSAKSTGSDVGCSSYGEWLCSTFRCNLTTFSLTRSCLLLFQTQTLTCCLRCCQLSSINEVWHRFRQNRGRSIMSTLRNNLIHITMVYPAVTVSFIIALKWFSIFLPCFYNMASLKFFLMFNPTNKYTCMYWQLPLNYKITRLIPVEISFPMVPYVTGPPFFKKGGEEFGRCKQLTLDNDGFCPQCKAN